MHTRRIATASLASLCGCWMLAAAAAADAPRTAYSSAGAATASATAADPAVQAPGAAAPTAGRSARYTAGSTDPAPAANQLPSPDKRLAPQAAAPALRAASVDTASVDYSIYDARVSLLRDDDDDGFHHRFRVWFDADTSYFSADVYARLYLSYQGGPYYLYFTTEVFTIDGGASDDEYEVSTTLTSGYPSGYYDVAIDLFEAGSHLAVASADAYSDSSLAALPLEDLGQEYGGSGGASLFTGIVLLDDLDYDGYFHRFAIDIDVDLPQQDRLVYATIDLRTPHGDWLHEHTSANFRVSGTGAHDLLRVNADWQSGYPSGHYDFQVSVYDADTGALLVQHGPASPALQAVPLEDAWSDRFGQPPPPPPPGHGHTVSHGYGGSSAGGWWLLGLLGLALAGRRRFGND